MLQGWCPSTTWPSSRCTACSWSLRRWPPSLSPQPTYSLSLYYQHKCWQPCIGSRPLSRLLAVSAWVLGALYALPPATRLWGRYTVMENGMRWVVRRGQQNTCLLRDMRSQKIRPTVCFLRSELAGDMMLWLMFRKLTSRSTWKLLKHNFHPTIFSWLSA